MSCAWCTRYITTFTCDPKWPEITQTLEPGQRPHDRVDIVVRVYHMKLIEYIDDIKSGKAFGKIKAGTAFCFSYCLCCACYLFVWCVLCADGSLSNTFYVFCNASYY